jgi:5-methylcytosine-specific restriction protein A
MKLKTLKPRLQVLSTDKAPTLGTSGWRTAGMKTAERGYGGRWQTARVRFLQQHPLCVMCSQIARTTAATVVDHKVPHRGDQALFWDEGNWQPLCKPHHDGEKQRQEARGEV